MLSWPSRSKSNFCEFILESRHKFELKGEPGLEGLKGETGEKGDKGDQVSEKNMFILLFIFKNMFILLPFLFLQ